MFPHFSFVLVAARFFVRSAFILLFIPIFAPSIFFHFFFDGFNSTNIQHLTIVPLDFNKYSSALVEIGVAGRVLSTLPFLISSFFFLFANSLTKTELFTFCFVFSYIVVGSLFGLRVWFFDLRFIPGLFTTVNPPFFIAGIKLDINRRDLAILITSLVGDRKDTIFSFSIFFSFLALSFLYPHFICFKTPITRWFTRIFFVFFFIYRIGGEGFYYDFFIIILFSFFFEFFLLVRQFFYILHRKTLFYPHLR